MNSRKYVINLCMNHDPENPLEHFESSTPYLAIHAGDLISTKSFQSDSVANVAPAQRFRVVEVEHLISGDDELDSHILFVFLSPA